jgi:hypothetical protein
MAKIYGQKSKYLVSKDNKGWVIGVIIIPLIAFIIWFYFSKLILNIATWNIDKYIVIIFMLLIFLCFKKTKSSH